MNTEKDKSWQRKKVKNVKVAELATKKKKNWIKGAIKRPGALTKKAKAEGKTVSQYCAKKRSGRTAKQCGLAKTLKKMKKKS